MAFALRFAIGTALLSTAAAIAGAVVATRRLTKQRANGDSAGPLTPQAQEAAVLHAIVDHAPVGIAFFTTDGQIGMANGFVRRLRSVVGEELRSWADIRPIASWEDKREITCTEWDALFEVARTKPVERVLRACPTGATTPSYFANVYAPVRAEDGSLIGVVSIIRDVSAERAIRQLREELVAVTAHDLRNPIAAMSLSLRQACLRTPDSEGCIAVPTEVLERMGRTAKRLGDMVGELLDAERVELGALALDRVDIDLRAFLLELVRDLGPSLRGHPVETDLPPHPVEASLDRLRIAQIVTNLLDNASKYSRDGSTIQLALREEGPTLHVSVTDQSEGIAAADVPNLFDRFYQAQKAREKKSGLGLGLYITKGMVEAHGGTLTVDTAPGVGSTFRVRLPRGEPG